MTIRIDRFFFDEKDVIIALVGVFLMVSHIFTFWFLPVSRESMTILFLFFLLMRTITSPVRLNDYVIVALSGLVFSLVLSPTGLVIYLLVALIIHTRLSL